MKLLLGLARLPLFYSVSITVVLALFNALVIIELLRGIGIVKTAGRWNNKSYMQTVIAVWIVLSVVQCVGLWTLCQTTQ